MPDPNTTRIEGLEGKSVAINVTAEFAMDEAFRNRAHVFVGVTALDSSGVLVVPTTGTLTVKIKTDVNPEIWETPTGWGAIDITAAAGIATLSVAANILHLQVTTATVDAGVDTFQVRATANQT